jgi:hypothetical protein
LTLIGQGAEGERFAEGRLHVRAMTPKNRRRISEARLEENIERATVDAYNESEQVAGRRRRASWSYRLLQ